MDNASTKIDLKLLRQFGPLERLSENQLILLSSRVAFPEYRKKQQVIERGSSDGKDYFLISGRVLLEAEDGRTREIVAGSDSARSAVSFLQPRKFSVVALEDSRFLVIDQETLTRLIKEAPVAEYEVEEDSADDMGEHSYRVLMGFYADLKANRFTLPSLPDVAFKIRKTTDREDCNAEDIAKVVNTDPSIAAKLIRACNSPLYRGFTEVASTRDAVVRLGTQTTRQLVTVFAMRELYKSKHPELQEVMMELWNHARAVASIAFVLAQATPGLNADHAMLGGLIHEIGAIPVVVYAENNVELFADYRVLRQTIDELKTEIGSTIVERWGFARELRDVVEHAQEWEYDSGSDRPDYVELIQVAQVHSLIGHPHDPSIPGLDKLKAFRKFGHLELTPERSLQLIHDAEEKIAEVQAMLGAVA